MLEELLRDETRNPSETALAMLNFIQYELAAGGAPAETRLYSNLLGLLCERIFGSLDNQWKHSPLGWLSAQSRWSQINSNMPASLDPQQPRTISSSRLASPSRRSHTKCTAWDSDPVVRLLTTPSSVSKKSTNLPTLMETISNESENRPSVFFSFPFHALPSVLQDSFMTVIELSLIIVKGQNVISSLFTASNRYETLMNLVTDNDIRLFGEIFRKPLHEQPIGGDHSRAAKNVAEDAKPVHLFLSMLEYYLILFLRFPLSQSYAQTKRGTLIARPPQNVAGSAYRDSAPFGEMVYQYLFQRYLMYFVPYSQDLGVILLSSPNSSNCRSELFVRLIRALWMEAPMRVAPTNVAIETMIRQQHHQCRRNGTMESHTSYSSTLERSFDLVLLNSPYQTPPSHVKFCLRKLVEHLLSDPFLPENVKKYTAGDFLPFHAIWSLQTGLYNWIRATLRHASIHTCDSAFFLAVDLWLLWLEPWNWSKRSVNDSRQARPILHVPRCNERSKYHSIWEPYVAANLYFYLIPLAIFLRRSRELDFSKNAFSKSINVVERVFRLFTPRLIQLLQRLSLQHDLVRQHVTRLGNYAPLLKDGKASLSACQNDMHNLLEEIHMQHLKMVRELDVFDRLGAWLEGMFGKGVIKGERKELDELVARSRAIVGLPADYQVLPPGRKSNVSRPGSRKAARTHDGKLTEHGRAQIVNGMAKCNPDDVVFMGDTMYGVVRQHEFEWLVSFFVHISEQINAKLGLDDTKLVRINLRFLADYRNLIFTILIALFAFRKIF